MKCPKCRDTGVEPAPKEKGIIRIDACSLCTRLAEIEYRERKLKEAV